MADESRNDDCFSGGCAPPRQHDWEVLTMSASTFGSASMICNCDVCTGKVSTDGVSNPDSRLECCLLPRAAASEEPATNQIETAGQFAIGIVPPECAVPSTSRSEAELFKDEHVKAIHESEPAAAASEMDLFKNSIESSSVNQTGNPQGEERCIVISSEPDPFTDGWKPRRGNLLILDRLPGTLDTVNTFPWTAHPDVNDNPFERNNQKSKVDAGIQKVPFLTEVGGGKIEGTNEVKNKSEGQGKKISKSKLGNFCNEALSTTWWKRQASLLQARTQETNTFWSIAWTATVMGIVVVLGYRWQRERSQNQELRLQLSAKDAELSSLLHQFNRLKEVVNGRHQVPVARMSPGSSLISDH
eukprot:c26752_g1_i2 orf=452-1525(-)